MQQKYLNNLSSELFLTPLSHLGMLSMTGKDTKAFLQGQFSHDLELLNNQNIQFTSYNNPKGRVISTLHICQHQQDTTESIYLQCATDLLEKIQKRLQMFIMMSDVTLKNITNDTKRIGVSGSKAIDSLESLGYQLPNQENQQIQQQNLTIIKFPSTIPRFEIFAENTIIDALSQQLEKNECCLVTSENFWQYLDILSGIPLINQENTETFVAQTINLQLLNAISFNKGCYTGQEIIARMKYLGKLKKRMYRLTATTDQQIQINDLVYNEEKKCGQIVNFYQTSENSFIFLAMLDIKSAENLTLYLDQVQKYPVKVENINDPIFELSE